MRLLHPIAAIAENGMLYKDITQWLRQRTFALLFIGLLAVSELIAVLLGTADTGDSEQAGTYVFGLLTTVLAVFGFITALNGHFMTAREFGDRTFELYALAGMSLEKMVWGKLLSLMAQFIFGACCIIPFMFFAYLLGGVDFYNILWGLLSLFLAAPPIFLLALLVASYQKQRSLRLVGRLGIGFIAFLLLMSGGQMVVFFFTRGMVGGRMGGPLSFLFSDLTSGSSRAWAAWGILAVFYFQFCALLFYLCAQAMRPATDSREHIVKAVLFSMVAWLGIVLLWPSLRARGTGDFYLFFVFAWLIMLWLGLVYFYGPRTSPIIIRRRREALRGKASPLALIQRLIHFWFAPGATGFLITLILFMLLIGTVGEVLWLRLLSQPGVGPDQKREFLRYLSFPLSLPFFFSIPAVLFYRAKRLASMKLMPGLIAAFWIVGTMICVVLFAMQANRSTFTPENKKVLLWISALISPISTLFSEYWNQEIGRFSIVFYPARIILGIIGIFLMMHIIRRRRQLEAQPETSTVAQPTDTSTN